MRRVKETKRKELMMMMKKKKMKATKKGDLGVAPGLLLCPGVWKTDLHEILSSLDYCDTCVIFVLTVIVMMEADRDLVPNQIPLMLMEILLV